MRKTKYFFLLSTLALSILSFQVVAQDSLLISASLDNTLFESEEGNLSNAKGQLFVGVTNSGKIRRALLKFDLTGFEVDAETAASMIDSVQLRIQSNRQSDAGYSIDIHALTKDWGEGSSYSDKNGGGAGAPATESDATWLNTFYPNSFWESPGGDFEETVLAEITVAENTPFQFSNTSGALLEKVRSWILNPEENFGIILKNSDESVSKRALRFSSKDSLVTDEIYPKLILYSSGPLMAERETVSNENEAGLPDQVSLNQNYPNPFNPVTQISFELDKSSFVTLEVYDVLGQKIETLFEGTAAAGTSTYSFDASTLPTGIYFYRLRTSGITITRKMMLIK